MSHGETHFRRKKRAVFTDDVETARCVDELYGLWYNHLNKSEFDRRVLWAYTGWILKTYQTSQT